MAKTQKYFDLKKLMQELKETKGLPENISTEAMLWDEIMKKEVYVMADQMFPLIKEVHGKEYPKGTSIKPLATEYSVERLDTKEITSIRADITVIVDDRDIYHFECEIKKDGTMVLRMFEYDVHIALSYMDSDMAVRLPNSAVLYLSDNNALPDRLSCQIRFQDGGSYEYTVPVLKVQTYSLEEIKRKHLCVLIPFLPLRFRTRLHPSKKQPELSTEELTSFYEQIILLLEEEVANGYLTEANRKTILSLLRKSMIRVFYKDESLLKEVIAMTEPVLELEYEKVEKLEKYCAQLIDENKKVVAQKDEALSQKDSQIAELQKQLAELKNLKS